MRLPAEAHFCVWSSNCLSHTLWPQYVSNVTQDSLTAYACSMGKDNNAAWFYCFGLLDFETN